MTHVTEIDVKNAAGQTKTVATLDAVTALIGTLADAAETNPAAASATMLALLRGAITELQALAGFTDGLETLVTSSNTKLDQAHTDLATTLADLITALNGYVDGLETLVTSSNTKLDTIHTDLGTTLSGLVTTLNGYVDQLEGYVDGVEGALGTSAGVAVITDANGTIQQYLRGLIKQWIAGTLVLAALPAGSNEVGKTNIKHINVLGSTLTRPANTTAYAANDSISDNATAGSVTANTATVSDTNDDPVDLTEVLIDSTDTGFGGVQERLHAFTSDPTASSGVVGGDNAAWSNKKAGWAGSFSGTMVAFSDGSKGVLIPDGGPVRIMNVEASGKRIWWQMQTLGAATPSGNSTTFIPRFKGYQGRV